MSKFSNGGYVPSGLDFTEWVEYLEARDEAIDYQDFLETMGFEEDEELDSEEDLELSISEKEMDAVLKKIETMTKGLSESISSFPKGTKLAVLSELQEQTEARLLYLHLQKNDPYSTEFIFKSEPHSMAEAEKRCQTFTNINRILETEKFDVQDEELMNALKFYGDVLENEKWAESQSNTFSKWRNSLGGDVQAVYSKTLEKKLKEMKESVSNESENVHLHKKHKRKEMDWDR